MPHEPQSQQHLTGQPRSLFVRLLWPLAALCLAVPFAVWRMQSSTVYEGAALSLLVSGEGHLPYQYRALVPFLARMLSQAGAGAVLEPILMPIGLERVAAALGAPQDLAAIFLLLEILSAWGLLLSFRALAERFTVGAALPVLGSLGLLLGVLGLQQLSPSSALWYPSDIPAMLVVVLSYLALFSGRMAAFLPIFVVGCLNRETVLFLLPLAAIAKKGTATFTPAAKLRINVPVPFLAYFSFLVVTWAGIKAALFFAYRGNHGYPIHPNIFVNVETLSSPKGAVLALCAACTLLALSLWAVRRSGDARLKAALWAAGLFLLSILFVGKLDEFRVYLELLPLVVLVALVSIGGQKRGQTHLSLALPHG